MQTHNKRIILVGSVIAVLLATFVYAQVFLIPDHIDLQFDPINLNSKFEDHGFGNCVIENPVNRGLIGYYNQTDDQYYFTGKVGFGNGKCTQGMGWQTLNMTGITTLNQFKTAIKQKLRTRALYIYNLDTNLSEGRVRWNTGS